MAKKILHFIESGGLYGAESVILNLSREMHAEGDYEPVIGCIVSQPTEHVDLYDKALEFGLQAEKLVIRNSCFYLDIPRVASQLKMLDISLIHSHGYKPSVYGYLIALLSNVLITATCHLWFLQGVVPLKMRVMVKLELFFYRKFPVVIAVSEPIKQFLMLHGISGDKIKVIKNGIVVSDYWPINPEILKTLKAECEIAEGALCLLNVARLSRQKAQWHIITAAQHLKALGVKVKFLIVGEGALRPELQQQIENLALQDTVKLLGFRSDVKELLQVADIFLLPSLDEGMPIALLEAVASHTPVLATPVGDIPKLIQHGHSGVLVKVDDVGDLVAGICKMENAESLNVKLAESAFAKMQRSYSSGAMNKQYHLVYREIFS